jgi:hypothetical protein
MSHDVTVNFGIFPAGHRVEVGGYDLCRECAWAGRIAVFDKGEHEPVAYIAPGIKSSFEALVWLDGFRSGYRHGRRPGVRCTCQSCKGLLRAIQFRIGEGAASVWQ